MSDNEAPGGVSDSEGHVGVDAPPSGVCPGRLAVALQHPGEGVEPIGAVPERQTASDLGGGDSSQGGAGGSMGQAGGGGERVQQGASRQEAGGAAGNVEQEALERGCGYGPPGADSPWPSSFRSAMGPGGNAVGHGAGVSRGSHPT